MDPTLQDAGEAGRQAGRRGQTDCQADNFPGEQQTLSDFHTAADVMMSEFRPEYAQMRN